MTATKPPPHRYQLSHLDGIRGIGVLLVMLYHLGVPGVQQAWLCISCFFCLSGLLITGITVEAFERTGEVGVLGFWSRRIARLFPALFLLVAAIALSSLYRSEDEVQLWLERTDLWWALGYLTNINLIYWRKDDYFTATSRPSITRHLWTLALEEQYYIVWPLLFMAWTRLFAVSRRRSSSDVRPRATAPSLGESLLDPEEGAHGKTRGSPHADRPVPHGGGGFTACVWWLAAGECVVMLLSYLSSLWTIRRLGLSAAYYSTLCRAGDFAAGGLAYCLVRLSPSIYPRYSQQPGQPHMSTACRVGLELGSALALALLVLPPLIPGSLEDVLPWYFHVFRLPYNISFVAALVPGALQLSQPLPRWAAVTRFLCSKPVAMLGTLSYGIYLFHWPLFVYLGEPAEHEKITAGAGSDKMLPGAMQPARRLPDVVLFLLPIGLALLSFWAVEKPFMTTARKASKRPGRVIAAGVAGAVLIAALVGVCYSGVANPYTGDVDLEAVFGPPSTAGGPPMIELQSLLGVGGHNIEDLDQRFTPVTLLSGFSSDQLLRGILDAHTAPEHRACSGAMAAHGDDPRPCLASNVLEMYQHMRETQPANAVIIACDTQAPLGSPCDYGPWEAGIQWVWLRSPVLCTLPAPYPGLGEDARADVLRRCPDVLTISVVEMGAAAEEGGVGWREQAGPALLAASTALPGYTSCASDANPKECRSMPGQPPIGGHHHKLMTAGGLRTYTGASALDNIYLMRLVLKLETVVPGAVNRGSQARLMRELGHQQDRLRNARRDPGGPGSADQLKIVVLGESVGARMGGIWGSLLDLGGRCRQRRAGQGRGAFLEVQTVNLCKRGHSAIMHFLACEGEPPNGAEFNVTYADLRVCRQRPQDLHIRREARSAMALSKPHVVVVHDAHWSPIPAAHAPFLKEAMSGFLSHAMEAGVKLVVLMTPYQSDVESRLRSAGAMDAHAAYFAASQCREGQTGIAVAVLDWHHLTCPDHSKLPPTERCPRGAHGFLTIMPDDKHPSGPPGDWLGAQALSAIVAQAARSVLGVPTWDAALANPVSSCLLQEFPPVKGGTPLGELVHIHRVCPS
eukprot:jgi/Tetstr1/431045/TSEL_020762.t1